MWNLLSNIFSTMATKSTPVEETQSTTEVPVTYDFQSLRDFTASSPLYSQIETHILEIERLINIK